MLGYPAAASYDLLFIQTLNIIKYLREIKFSGFSVEGQCTTTDILEEKISSLLLFPLSPWNLGNCCLVL